ncbi:MAG: TIGR03619 family F420-dependent LLM class oxidoreductase [Chloroflexia bacterium]
MDLGITVPTSGPHASPAGIVKMAQAAEDMGYTAVWTYERLLYALGDIVQQGGPPRPLPANYKTIFEPIETLSYIAAKTKTIKLGTSVLVAPFHVPVMLARRLATLDQFSEGRVIAGLGQGWMAEEFATANIPMSRKGSSMEEFIGALRAAWGPDPVEFKGRVYNIPKSEINPKPVQPGGIPILLGSHAPVAIERAARVADGLNPIGFSFEALQNIVGRFRSAAQEAGRDPSKLKVMVRANVPITSGMMEEKCPFLGGSPEQIGDDLARLGELAIDHVFFTNNLQPPLDEQIELLKRIQKAVR